jgi:K+-transporting ATPase KdpF subunit
LLRQAEVMELLGLILAIGLLAYLFLALIRPEKFS